MILPKLIGLCMVTALFFYGFVFGPFYGHIGAQIGALILMWLGVVLRFSMGSAIASAKFCLPFVLTLLGFGVIFHLTEFMGRRDWLTDSLIKATIFPSSFFFLKLVFSFITYLDLLRLPIPMSGRVDLITFKAAMEKGGHTLTRFNWYLGTYSGLSGNGLKGRFLKRPACLIISLFIYLYTEIDQSKQLFENRRKLLSQNPLPEDRS